jgi:hypothetical protein
MMTSQTLNLLVQAQRGALEFGGDFIQVTDAPSRKTLYFDAGLPLFERALGRGGGLGPIATLLRGLWPGCRRISNACPATADIRHECVIRPCPKHTKLRHQEEVEQHPPRDLDTWLTPAKAVEFGVVDSIWKAD